MHIKETNISGALIIEPNIFKDDRGWFMEAWNLNSLYDRCEIDLKFVQENHSYSKQGVLRGLHYQLNKPQGKLVRVSQGKVLDVIVDLRKSSDSFGQNFIIELSSINHKQLWIPPGLAHGFFVLSESAEFIYQTTDYYDPEDEHTLLWNDKDLGIDWQLNGITPVISSKDLQGSLFKEEHYFD
jgi:dTDP-4-dehydrorhamnose 3,5-epimerase